MRRVDFWDSRNMRAADGLRRGAARPVKSQRTRRSLELVALTSLGGLLCVANARNASYRQARVSGTVYYVDSRSGNDANTGMTPSAAWKTLDKVNATTFEPGDQILLK